MGFKVGDLVVDSRMEHVGKVVSVSEKRGDVTVDYDHFRQTYNSAGWKRGGDSFYKSYIEELTPEIKKRLMDKAEIVGCIRLFETMKSTLTAEQARKIRNILNGTDLVNVPEEPKSSTISNTDL